MTDPTNSEPIERPWKRGDPTRRCVAHKKSGEQCRRWAIRGGVVCRYHGGSAPQVIAKARENMALAANHNRSNVQRLADAAESEQVRLQASNSLIDRVLGRPTTTLELGPKQRQPWEDVIEHSTVEVARLTKAQHDAMKRGEPLPLAPAALAPADDIGILDAEVVDPADDPARAAPVDDGTCEGAGGAGSPPPASAHPTGPSSTALVTLEEANADINDTNRRAKVVPIRRGH